MQQLLINLLIIGAFIGLIYSFYQLHTAKAGVNNTTLTIYVRNNKVYFDMEEPIKSFSLTEDELYQIIKRIEKKREMSKYDT